MLTMKINIKKEIIEDNSVISLGVNVINKLVEKLFGYQDFNDFKGTLRSIKIDVDFLYNLLNTFDFQGSKKIEKNDKQIKENNTGRNKEE